MQSKGFSHRKKLPPFSPDAATSTTAESDVGILYLHLCTKQDGDQSLLRTTSLAYTISQEIIITLQLSKDLRVAD